MQNEYANADHSALYVHANGQAFLHVYAYAHTHTVILCGVSR